MHAHMHTHVHKIHKKTKNIPQKLLRRGIFNTHEKHPNYNNANIDHHEKKDEHCLINLSHINETWC